MNTEDEIKKSINRYNRLRTVNKMNREILEREMKKSTRIQIALTIFFVASVLIPSIPIAIHFLNKQYR